MKRLRDSLHSSCFFGELHYEACFDIPSWREPASHSLHIKDPDVSFLWLSVLGRRIPPLGGSFNMGIWDICLTSWAVSAWEKSYFIIRKISRFSPKCVDKKVLPASRGCCSSPSPSVAPPGQSLSGSCAYVFRGVNITSAANIELST